MPQAGLGDEFVRFMSFLDERIDLSSASAAGTKTRIDLHAIPTSRDCVFVFSWSCVVELIRA